MIWGNSWIIITLIALVTDFIFGEFPIKHPVQYMGDFINWFELNTYKNSIIRGAILTILLVFIVIIISICLQFVLLRSTEKNYISPIIAYTLLGIISSTGLAANCLRDHILKVINSNEEKMRSKLSFLVTRNTSLLSDEKVYSSLIETHAENLSDAFIAPLLYLILFGLPGIMVFKAISTLDSMIGYKNDKYIKFGKIAAKLDDVLNYIPSRLTALIIWLYSQEKISWKILISDAKAYSSSPNAGFPIAAAAYYLGVKLGGSVYYGDTPINKAEIGVMKSNDFKNAVMKFINFQKLLELVIILLFILIFFIQVLCFHHYIW